MARYQTLYEECRSELDSIKKNNEKRDADSIARSAILFIQSKGLSEEWAAWIVKEIDERTKAK